MLVKLSSELGRFDSITEANKAEDKDALLEAAQDNLKTIEGIMRESQRTHFRYFRQVLSLRELVRNLTGVDDGRN